MKGKKRPTSERMLALGIAVVDGPKAASDQTGIPESTVRSWMDTDEFAQLRNRTKEAVAEEWWAIVQEGMRRVRELLPDSTDIQKTATATAIIADKMLLIRGEPTSIAHLNLAEGMDDHERELLSDAIRGELARRADSHAAETAVEPAVPTGAATA